MSVQQTRCDGINRSAMVRFIQFLLGIVDLSICLTSSIILASREPLLVARPGIIELGLTSTLTMNCSYPPERNHDSVTIVGIDIYRQRSTTWIHLAKAQVDMNDSSVFVQSGKRVHSTGFLSDIDNSYLALQWDTPTSYQEGNYLCQLHMLDAQREPVTFSSHIHVKALTPAPIVELQRLTEENKMSCLPYLSFLSLKV